MVKPSVLLTEGNVNEALRNALRQSGLSQLDLAAHLSVDPKTVDKWLGGRTPHPRTRTALAKLLSCSENELWPSTMPRWKSSANSEIRAVYPHRWTVPRDVWWQVFQRAERQIDIQVYSGLFLAEDNGVLRLLIQKAEAGAKIRLLLGDPDCAQVVQRGIDEGAQDSPVERIRNALRLFRPLIKATRVETRLHNSAIYNSVIRGDDDLLVNPYIYGVPSAIAPVLHLYGVRDGSAAAMYVRSLENTWNTCSTIVQDA